MMSPYNLALAIVEVEKGKPMSEVHHLSRIKEGHLVKLVERVVLSTYTGLLETTTAFMDLTIQCSLVMEQCTVRVSIVRM